MDWVLNCFLILRSPKWYVFWGSEFNSWCPEWKNYGPPPRFAPVLDKEGGIFLGCKSFWTRGTGSLVGLFAFLFINIVPCIIVSRIVCSMEIRWAKFKRPISDSNSPLYKRGLYRVRSLWKVVKGTNEFQIFLWSLVEEQGGDEFES